MLWLTCCSSCQDGRLRTGDHILRIGATPTSGLTSDQVVKVLQGCGSQVTLLIARDPRGQPSTAPPPPPPPDSAPVSSLPPRSPGLPPPGQLSKTVSSQKRRRRESVSSFTLYTFVLSLYAAGFGDAVPSEINGLCLFSSPTWRDMRFTRFL